MRDAIRVTVGSLRLVIGPTLHVFRAIGFRHHMSDPINKHLDLGGLSFVRRKSKVIGQAGNWGRLCLKRGYQLSGRSFGFRKDIALQYRALTVHGGLDGDV